MDLFGLPPHTMINVKTFTTSGTYHKPNNLLFAKIICAGGGGGGGQGNPPSAVPDTAGVGGGGGGGAQTAISWLMAKDMQPDITVTIGAAGTGGTTTDNAGSGGDTSFDVLVVAKGGLPGTGVNGVYANPGGPGGGGGPELSDPQFGTGQLLLHGQPGGNGVGFINTLSTALSGQGGNSFLGGGARGKSVTSGSSNGFPASYYGGGGGGGVAVGATNRGTGGAGAAGVCFVVEFLA